MLRLRTLGTLALDGVPQTTGAAALQPRRLAMLAAVGAELDGISRDTLLGLLWPEASEARARHALNQSLYALRRAAGIDDLFVGTHRLRLNPDRITVDRWEFERALADGKHEVAAQLYAGPFLHGVFISDTPEFERWMEAERARLARAYVGALHELAASADAREAGSSITWWRRLTAVDPLDSRATLGLMRALAATGDYAGAIREAQEHEQRMRTELGIAPVQEVPDLARSLRERRDATRVVPSEAKDLHVAAVIPSGARPVRTVGARNHALVVAGVFTVILAAAFAKASGVMASSNDAPAVRPDSNVVAVLPFRVFGDSTRELGVGLADLLRGALDGAGALRAADMRAVLSHVPHDSPTTDARVAAGVSRAIGAGLFVTGEATLIRNRVQISAELRDVRDAGRAPARASAEGSADSLIDVIDRAAVALFAAHGGSPRERLASVAARTTTSLPALKLFLEAERHMRDGEYSDALPPLREAVRLDTGFALAFYRMSIAADWSGENLLADSAAAEAARRRSRLSTRDQWLVDALLAWRRRDVDEADRRYRSAVLHQPGDLEAWYQLGEVYFHDNPGRGLSFAASEAPFRRVAAMEPTNVDVRHHLIRVLLWEQRWHELDSVMALFGPSNTPLRPYTALARHDTAALRRSLDELAVVDANSLYIIGERLTLYSRDATVGARAFLGLVTPDRPPAERASGFAALADIAAARGHWREARAFVDSMGALVPRFALETDARLALVPFAPATPASVRALRARIVTWQRLPGDTTRPWAGHPSPEQYAYRMADLDGHLAAIERDTMGVVHAMAVIARVAGDTPAASRWRDEQRSALAARLSESRGRIAAAIDAPPSPPSYGEWGDGAEARFLKARLLEQHGDLAEAARWFASFEQVSLDALAWAAPAHLMRAEILDRLGRRAEAAADYARVAELWRDCDAELVPLRDLAVQRASRYSGSSAR